MKVFLTTIGLLVVLSINVQAYNFGNNHKAADDKYFADSNSLYFKFDNSNFFWNNEFFNNLVPGYTLIGYFAEPSIQYHFSNHVKVELGAHLLKYSGVDLYSTILPKYRISYKKKDLLLVMGTLHGTLEHNLPEPMFFSELYFTNHMESGVQIFIDKERLKFQTWVDWQNFIQAKDNAKEVISGGISTEFFLYKKNLEVSLPLSFLALHIGGQIGTSHSPLTTIYNQSAGVNLGYNYSNSFINKFIFSAQYLNFIDNSSLPQGLYKNGYGYLTSLQVLRGNSFFKLSYWYADRFLSSLGHPIYQTSSFIVHHHYKINRSLITASAFYSRDIFPGIYLGLTGNVYWDIYRGVLDYTTGLTITIKQDFLIKRFSKPLFH